MEKLKFSDPEFYKYLQENDGGLLEFDGPDDQEDDENDFSVKNEIDASTNADEELSENESEPGDIPKKLVVQEVTTELFHQTMEGAISGSINDLKRIMAMFKAASQPIMMDDEGFESFPSVHKYTIPNPEIYEVVMSETVGNMHKVLAKHLDLKVPFDKKSLEMLISHRRWKKLQMTILIFFKIILQNLHTTGLHVNHAKVTLFFLDSMENYIPFLAPLPRLTKTVIKVLLNLWAGPFVDEDQEKQFRNVRGHSFIRLRQLALQLPGSVTEECLRMAYLKYARRCKTFSEGSMSCVLYLTNCVAELYKCDVALAYQQSFLYIRQLALHLRAAFIKKGETAMKVIRCWQFINCLRLWTKVVCTLPTSDSGLGVLCFPLSQVLLGVMTLLPSPYYSPLRLHLISYLQQLAGHCQVFIPVGFCLCEMLEYTDLFTKPSASTEILPGVQFILNFPPNSLSKVAIRDSLLSEVFHLLRVEIEIYKYNPGFPEYSFLIARKLKGFCKKVIQTKWRDAAKNLSSQIQHNAQVAKSSRNELGLSPINSFEFEVLRPKIVEHVSERLPKLLAARSKLMPSAVVKKVGKAKVVEVPSESPSSAETSDVSDDEENIEVMDQNQDDEVELLRW